MTGPLPGAAVCGAAGVGAAAALVDRVAEALDVAEIRRDGDGFFVVRAGVGVAVVRAVVGSWAVLDPLDVA
jgi:hypothetical protein